MINNGVDFAHFAFDPSARARLRAAWGLRDDEVAIGSVGRFDPQKGHANVARALAGLECDDWRWVLAGAGCDAQNPVLAGMLDGVGVRDRTLLLGPRSDVPDVLSALDLLVIGSAFGEALPVVGLEAVANDLPVVATRVGSAACLFTELTLVAAPDDPSDLRRAIAAAWPMTRCVRPSVPALRKRLELAS